MMRATRWKTHKYGPAPMSTMRIAVLAIFSALVLSGCTTSPGDAGDLDPTIIGDERKGHPLEGMAAPAYSAYDLDGEPVALADYLGRPVLFHIWATWCTVCEGEEPILADLYDEYGDVVEFVMVSIDSRSYESDLREETAQWPYTNWWDPSDDVRPLFQVSYQPVSIFIDANGTIESVWQGQRADKTTLRSDPDAARAILDRLVAQA